MLFLVFMTFQQDSEISLLKQNVKILAQHIAILEGIQAKSKNATGNEHPRHYADAD